MKTAREVIAEVIVRWFEADLISDEEKHSCADDIYRALEAEGYKVLNADEFAEALDKGRKFRDRIEKQTKMIAEAQLRRLNQGLDVDP